MGNHAWQRWGCLLAHEPKANLAYCRYTGNMDGKHKKRFHPSMNPQPLPICPLLGPAPPALEVVNEQ